MLPVSFKQPTPISNKQVNETGNNRVGSSAACQKSRQLPKPRVEFVPFLCLPVQFSEKLRAWYLQKAPSLIIPVKYCGHFFGNVLAMLLLPISMTCDLIVGGIAITLIPFNSKNRTNFKQLAWNCLICGTFGPATALLQIAKRMLYPKAF
jgi:hypothetical protein